jgi:organic hydroperoxide reductase OsmC/OhrA
MDFETRLDWRAGFSGTITFQNGHAAQYSAPVEFKGVKGPLTPEDAFVGSANMCFQIVFERVAMGMGMKLLEYRCRAVGALETVGDARKFVKIVLYPEMRFAPGSNMSNLEKALETTKRKCPVTNSMALEFEIEPKVLE